MSEPVKVEESYYIKDETSEFNRGITFSPKGDHLLIVITETKAAGRTYRAEAEIDMETFLWLEDRFGERTVA